MRYLPSRWDSEDEATGPQMDEITTVVLARRSVPERVRSAAPTTPAAELFEGLIKDIDGAT